MTRPNGVHSVVPALAVLALAGGAMAQSEREVTVLKGVFASYDADKDGNVVRGEFPGSDRQFAAMDGDRNGKVSFDEYKVSAAARLLLAARNRDAGPPRERVERAALALRRLAAMDRFDKNRDGRVTRSEWTGAPDAFAALDIDRNGKLDTKDRNAWSKKAEEGEAGAAVLFAEFKARLPSPEEIFKRRDKNKDELLSPGEVRGAKFEKLFGAADRNRDNVLDMYEVRGMCGAVSAQVTRRNYGNLKARPYRVPFSTWDKNKDGRIDTGEWMTGQQLFARIDLDRDGAITKVEIDRYELSVEGDNFVERYDLNGDGRVTAKEFSGSLDAFRRADRNGDGVVSGGDR